MPVQQVRTLLAVALRPGLTMKDLADDVGMAQSSCSRNVSTLSKWEKIGKPGLNLVEAHEDPRERRRKLIYLTPKGRDRVVKALEAITGSPADFTPVMAREGLSRLA